MASRNVAEEPEDVDYSGVSQEDFTNALEEILDGMSGAELLAVPGVYEAVSEELNNEALERARENAEARGSEKVNG